MHRLLRLSAQATLAAQLLGADAAHYGQPPCQSGEVQSEVQGASGNMCSPLCTTDQYTCPTDIAGLANAQPQCMLKDAEEKAYCGLLCQTDTQCPTGAQCKQMTQMGVGLCLYPVSFTDWSRGSSTKLALGLPSGKGSATALVQKTQTALTNMKTKYSITDSDADMVILQELVSSMLGQAPSTPPTPSPVSVLLGQSAAPAPAPSDSNAPYGLSHDVNQFETYLGRGLPGIEQEIGDTVWNIENFNQQYAATNLLNGVLWVIAFYVGVGSFFKYQQGAQGMDMIPHVGFWAEFPDLVNDGVIYAKILLGIAPADSGSLKGGIPGSLSGVPRSGEGAFETL